MPTISQLPTVSGITAADMLPLSQDGATCAVSVGALLAGTQPAILTDTATLLGRVSVGPGGPEVINVGNGLALSGSTLAATGSDHARFPPRQTFSDTDELVISGTGTPALLPVTALRGLFLAGENISISSLGVISTSEVSSQQGAGSTKHNITALPVVSSISGQDLLAASQNGDDCAITVLNFLDGQTIDMMQAAGFASDADTFLVSQSNSTMSRQTLAALWPWVTSKLPTFRFPIIEITANTSLDGAVHNGRVLLCSGSVTLSLPSASMGNGFQCDVINIGSSNVALSGGIVTSSGLSMLGAGQCMKIYVATYSSGTIIYGWMGASNAPGSAPGQVTDLASSSSTSESVTLIWSNPSSGGAAAGFNVNFRISGSSTWTMAVAGIVTNQYAVTSLSAATTYQFMVVATNGTLSGGMSNIATATTATSAGTISAPTNLSVSSTTSTSIALAWIAPTTGTAQSYTLQYRPTGTSVWSNIISGLQQRDYTATDLTAGQSYDWRVTAIDGDGASATSSIIVAATLAASGTATAITWNVAPTGSFVRSSGALGMNAHVTPSSAAVEFGMSTSTTTPPSSWTAGLYVNTDLWGAYVNTPASPGTWYAWVQGLDGSSRTVSPNGITVT